MMHNELIEFEWDDGNISKIKQRFTLEEVEEFFIQELMVLNDTAHSESEERLIAVGNGPNGKPMFVCYTLRGIRIRIISARYMRLKEAKKYEIFKKNKKN